MAVQLVPYMQDEKKWTDHYLAQAMKQIKPVELTKQLKERAVNPSIVLPTMQLAAQAKSEMKREKDQSQVFAPIKITPEFETAVTSTPTLGGNTRKRRKGAARNTLNKKPKTDKAKKSSQKTKKKKKKSQSKDIFD